jgi:hypothetical protein
LGGCNRNRPYYYNKQEPYYGYEGNMTGININSSYGNQSSDNSTGNSSSDNNNSLVYDNNTGSLSYLPNPRPGSSCGCGNFEDLLYLCPCFYIGSSPGGTATANAVGTGTGVGIGISGGNKGGGGTGLG